MKKFWKDYVDLCKSSLNFMKTHWVGTIIVYLILFALYMINYFLVEPWAWDDFKDWFASVFHKK